MYWVLSPIVDFNCHLKVEPYVISHHRPHWWWFFFLYRQLVRLAFTLDSASVAQRICCLSLYFSHSLWCT